MSHRTVALLLGLALAACATTTPSVTPASVSPPASLTGTAPPLPTPLRPPTLAPGETPSPTGCGPQLASHGPWPSDRLVAVDPLADGTFGDRVVFRFGPPSRPGATSTIDVREATGPFTEAGSGEPVQVAGSMFHQVRIEGLLLFDDQGKATFQGALDQRPNLTRVKHVVAIEAFEGAMTWIVGSDFTCVGLETEPAAGTVALTFSLAVP